MDRRTFSKNILTSPVPMRVDKQMLLKVKVLDKIELVEYGNKNSFVRQTDNFFVSIKNVLDIRIDTEHH